MATRRPPPPTRTAVALAAALVLLHRPRHPFARAEHVPFGYQSDSTHSLEYRSNDPADPQSSPIDPSTYAGSVHYDPLHHALYVTGATFASDVFDGVDVFGLTTTEEAQLKDNVTHNDGYWWNDMMTGLMPHLQDLGVPEYSPRKGDCFYAVMGLPNGEADPGVSNEENRVKHVHSRRFGTEGVAEACSAIDVLHASVRKDEPGGYLHEFEHAMEEYDVLNPSENTPLGPPADMPADAMAPPIDFTLGVTPPSIAPHPTPGPTLAGYDLDGGGRALGGAPGRPRRQQQQQRRQQRRQRQEHGLRRAEEQRERPSQDVESRAQHGGRSLQTDPARMNEVKTRSVRLLMAGHVEPPRNGEGYVVSSLAPGTFTESNVYAFAQQVDVRLPAGDVERGREKPDAANEAAMENEVLSLAELDAAKAAAGNYDELSYALHAEGKEEDEFAREYELGTQSNTPQEEFERIVTSGVESRALLNEDLPASLTTVYPVALAADPTSKRHYYVLLLASDDPDMNAAAANEFLNADPTLGQGASQRQWTEGRPEAGIDALLLDVGASTDGDGFGPRGRPNYGSSFRVVAKKMAIDANVDPAELTAVDLNLAATSYRGETIAMRQAWAQEFAPDGGEDVRPGGLLFAPSGDPTGKGDVLVVAGTTAGRGDAFGTSDGESSSGGDRDRDLDGFVTKIFTDEGEFAGREKFDQATSSFINTYSKRIRSNPGQTEIVAGVCAKPLRALGSQDRTTHVYVVGSTSALLEGADPADERAAAFLTKYVAGSDAAMEAFLMKINLRTMNVVWTQQVGAIEPGATRRGNAFGYGCAVTYDGLDVHLSGLVQSGGVATDFSVADFVDNKSWPEGGTDVFVASYRTSDGSRRFLTQVGSTRDDFPSRGNGGIASDRQGNAILTGSTRGSLMRRRGEDEYRYGPKGAEAASDVFVLSLERGTGKTATVTHDGVDERVPPPAAVPVPSPPQQKPVMDFAGAEDAVQTKKSRPIVGILSICMGFICIAAASFAFVAYSDRARKEKEKDVLMRNNANLHDSGHNGRSGGSKGRRWRNWGPSSSSRRRRSSLGMDDFNNLDIMVEVRNSASGGWHGVYDDEQLQAIDFGVSGGHGSGGDDEDVVEKSLFMEDGLKEIEDSLDSYEIGDMDDVSDEDLIKAYNDAMALDIEPESDDVEFTMAGIGSTTILDDDDGHHQIT